MRGRASFVSQIVPVGSGHATAERRGYPSGGGTRSMRGQYLLRAMQWMLGASWRLWAGSLALAVLVSSTAHGSIQVSEPREPGLPDPILPVSASEPHQLASDGNQWLAVYSVSFVGHQLGMGRLIDGDGQPQGTAFPIAYDFFPKAVVFDGDDYVVFGSSNERACFTRVSAAGVASGTLTLLSPNNKRYLHLAAAAGVDG